MSPLCVTSDCDGAALLEVFTGSRWARLCEACLTPHVSRLATLKDGELATRPGMTRPLTESKSKLMPEQKVKLVRDARKLAIDIWHEFRRRDGQTGGRCVYYSLALMVLAIRRHNLRLLPQGGTLAWRFLPKHLDTGTNATCFTYEWQGLTEAVIERLTEEKLPEMHVWLADSEAQEVVDASTGSLPDQARTQMNVEWQTQAPPDFLWTDEAGMPEDALYRPEPDGCFVAFELLKPGGLCGRQIRAYMKEHDVR